MSDAPRCAKCGKELKPHPLGKILLCWVGYYQPCPDHPNAKVIPPPKKAEKVQAKGGKI